MPPSTPFPLDDLTRHAAELRPLARSILGDEHGAEDVVQQVFVRTILSPPTDRGALGAWLARVTRRLALNARRSERRRRAREREVARAGRVEGDAEAELAVRRCVLEAVAHLDEPYRSAVHLRYFRGMGPTRIARELGVPVKTVHARLTRAHRILRERLDRDFRREREGRSMLLLVPTAARATARAIPGGLLMTKQAVLAGVVAAALGGAWLAWRVTHPTAAPEPQVRARVGSAPTPDARPEQAAPDEAAAARTPIEPAAPPIAEAEEAPGTDPSPGTALDDVLEAIEGSFGGTFDPGAILDVALLLATHETGPALPEPSRDGGLRYPLRDLPEGIEAQLSVKRSTRGDLVLGLDMQFEAPRDPWLVAGLPRSAPSAHVGTWTDAGGELRDLTLSTSAQPGAGFPTDDLSEVPYGVSLHTPMSAPGAWRLTTGGIRAVDPAPDAEGRRSWQSADWDGGQVLTGGPWPREADMRRFNELLRARYDEIRQRSER